MRPTVFFGTGAGRCGTMSLANWLSAESGVQCLHEGKERRLQTPGDQWLPFLTLQNFGTYKNPESAEETLRKTRGTMAEKAAQAGLTHLGDVAYNYAPFVAALPQVFPQAKLVVLVRDGRDFVRSVVTDEVPDPTPVGWLEDGREMTQLERFIALGRLRPLPGTPAAEGWADWNVVEKNAWLWAETYRLIFDGLDAWNPDHRLVVRYERLMADIPTVYQEIRDFLGIEGPISPATRSLLETKINARRRYVLPPKHEWDAAMMAAFDHQAAAMMRRLGYYATEG